ncbi:hypothetical protein MHU86_24090 [Fragilaria crotonensis]|nr:hypothetical protein MHU86_24090 [Fragilaria crotonensis]
MQTLHAKRLSVHNKALLKLHSTTTSFQLNPTSLYQQWWKQPHPTTASTTPWTSLTERPATNPANTNNHRRTNAPSTRPSTQQQRTNRPPLRQLPNSNHRPSTNGKTNNQNRNQSNAANIVCNNCGRLGHYSRNCTNPARNATSNRGPSSRSSSNNENSAPAINNEPTLSLTQENMQENVYHQAFRASSLDPMDDTPDSIPWPNPALPKWRSTNTSLIKTFNLLAITLLPILEHTISLMTHNLLINVLAHLFLKIGFLTVVQPATTHQSSVTSMMSHPAVYLSPLLMAVLNCLPTKAPQNVPSLLMMV